MVKRPVWLSFAGTEFRQRRFAGENVQKRPVHLQVATYVICRGAVELAGMTIQLYGNRVITSVCRRRSHRLAGKLRLVSHLVLFFSRSTTLQARETLRCAPREDSRMPREG